MVITVSWGNDDEDTEMLATPVPSPGATPEKYASHFTEQAGQAGIH